MKKVCDICSEKVGIMTSRIELDTGEMFCGNCAKKAKIDLSTKKLVNEAKFLLFNDIKNKVNYFDLKVENFSPNFEVGSLIKFDDKQQILKTNFKQISFKANEFVLYEDILDISVTEDNDVIKKSGAGRALGGGLLFGPTGALIGGLSSRGKNKKNIIKKLAINLIFKDGSIKTIHFINSETKLDSFLYKTEYKNFLSAGAKFEEIVQNIDNINSTYNYVDFKDKLIKLKELLDLDIITEKEFNQKKEQILKNNI